MIADAQLVARARRGDLEAFGQLIERYEKTLLALALAECRDLHTAEDVVQTSLLLAFRRLATLRDDGKFGPWLMQIARRQVTDVARTRRLPVASSLDGAPLEAVEDHGPAWAEHEHLLSLVARLPEHERLLIGLRYFDGHSMAEIAARSARPVGTVTKQLSRAVARLRAWWDKETLR